MQNKDKNNKFISVSELAQELGISRIAVFKKIQKGQIPAEKVGRSYVINREHVGDMGSASVAKILTADKKEQIQQAIAKVVQDYGQTLRLLGKE